MTRPVLVLFLIAAAGAGGLFLGATIRPAPDAPVSDGAPAPEDERVEIVFLDVAAGECTAILTSGPDRRIGLVDGDSLPDAFGDLGAGAAALEGRTRLGPLEIVSLRSGDRLLALRVVLGENSVLFPVAAGEEPGVTEAALLELDREQPGRLRSTVLRIPRAGRPASSSSAFLDAVGARWAVMSSSEGAPVETLLRYLERRIPVLRTDAGDGDLPTPGDDHVILRMGRREGDLRWRRVDTETLVSECR